jgi:hypothetical protein
LKLYLHPSSSSEFNPKIALLVCLSSRTSRAVIGFSASGTREVRREIIEDRRKHLPELDKISNHDLRWSVGNCAEAEAFAHLKRMEGAGPSETIAVSLAVDLRKLTSHGPCLQCGDLFCEFRSDFTVTLSLAPLKGCAAIQQRHICQ